MNEWLEPAYRDLCERTDSLSLDEAQRLGMNDVVKISSLRQDIRMKSSSPNPFTPKAMVTSTLLNEVFGIVASTDGDGHAESEFTIIRALDLWLIPSPSLRCIARTRIIFDTIFTSSLR